MALDTPTLLSVNSHNPLAPTPGPLSLFTRDQLILGMPPAEAKAHKIGRLTLKGVGVTLATLGKVPFISINMKLGENNKVYGGVLDFSNCVSFAALISRALTNMVDDYLAPLGEAEKSLVRSKNSKSLDHLILISSVALGILSQVPFAYLAYVYNAKSLLMPLAIFASDSWYPVYSTNLSLRNLSERRNFSIFEKDLAKYRNNLIKFVKESRFSLITDEEHREAYLLGLQRIRSFENPDNQSAEYMTLLSTRNIDPLAEPPPYCKFLEKVITGVGAVATASNFFIIGFLGFKGMELIWPNPFAEAIMAILTVGANAYLNGTSIPNMAVSLFTMITSSLRGLYQPTVADQLAPKLAFALKSLSMIMASLSYGPSVQISRDYFEGAFSTYLEVSLSLATILLVASALLDLSDEITENYIIHTGSEEEQQLLQLHHQMIRFSKVLKKSPLLALARFLKILPRGLFDKLNQTIDLSRGQLNEYIRQQLDKDTQPLLQELV